MTSLKYKILKWFGYWDAIETDNKNKSALVELEKKFKTQVDMLASQKVSEHGYVNPQHVFQVSQSGIPYIGLEPITKLQAKILQENAKLLKQMEIWKVIQETIRQQALNKGILNSQTWEEVLAGKMMLYNLGLIKSIVDSLDSIKLDKIAEHSGVREVSL